MKKTNVLYLSMTGQGGATFSLFNMIKSIKENINPIVVFPDTNGVYQMFADSGIECIVVPFQEEIFYVGQFQHFPLTQKFRFLGGRFRNIIKWNTTFNKQVKNKLGTRKIDIVHTNNGAIDLGPSLAKILNARHVWHLREFQDLDFDARPFFGWKRFYKKLYASDAAIGITKAIADHFHILTTHRLGRYIWNAVASREDAVYFKDKEPYICFSAAKISWGKGLHDLIRAYAASTLPAKGITLKVIGVIENPEYKERILKLVAELGLSQYIEWLGFCQYPKKIVAHAQALVMPSANEALGRVAIEAMLYGCPAIARRKGGPMEYISNHGNGYLFKDVTQLAETLDYVVSHDQNELIRRAQNFAINNFTEEIYAKKIIAVYSIVTKP